MQKREWRFEGEHRKWRIEPGAWDLEPDKLQWMSETGFPCLIVRNVTGALCGYVGVSEGHPWYHKEYGTLMDVDVHGGLSFSSSCNENEPEHGICHVVDPGEDDKVWWLGFDCAHAFDLVPGLRRHGLLEDDTVYRDVAYVKNQCEKLAQQAQRAKAKVQRLEDWKRKRRGLR